MSKKKHDFNLKELRISAAPHPSIAITAGIHGDEQTGTHAAMLVWEKLKSEKLLGTVNIYPFCNEQATRAKRRAAPQDDLDLNRTFPGSCEGSYSEQLAAHIWSKTENEDYVLDLHCAGLYSYTYTMSWYSKHERAHELCRALGVDTVLHTMGTRGQLYIESYERREQYGLLVELPGGQPGGVINEQAAEDIACKIINYLKYIGVIEGQAGINQEVRFYSCFDVTLKIPHDGLFRPNCKAGDVVKKGQAYATLDGEPLLAPEDILISNMPPMHYTFAETVLSRVATPNELPFGAVKGE